MAGVVWLSRVKSIRFVEDAELDQSIGDVVWPTSLG